ncbi:MAG: hypothetical protein GQ544_08275 [Candidatus Aminicenantes bacterium]|nr:hypothetical protein [Candidatus Aminicenantes bacterium]
MSFPRFLFITCLVFFIIRNLVLSLAMPLWVAGDELAHVDYALKLSRGHIPETTEFIEPELFELHKDHWDHRYLSTDEQKPEITDLKAFGLGAYCYQANHPPLPHFILSLFRKVFQFLGLTLLLQVKLMRLVSLSAALLGILLIYFELRKNANLGAAYFLPLLCLPLLAQDMFFCVNNDVYSFLFGCLAVAGMFRLYKNPHSTKNWLWLTVAVSLAMWVKLTNVLFFGLWVLFALTLIISKREKKLILPSSAYFFLTVLLSSPWHIFNQIRYHSIWATHIIEGIPGMPVFHASSLTLLSLWNFFRAFTRTFFRGELLWEGKYFDLFSEGMNDVFLTCVSLLFVCIALASSLKAVKIPADHLKRFFSLSAFAVILALLYGQSLVGNIPYYHARLSLGCFYFLIFPLCLGALYTFRSERLTYAILFLGLLLYNFFYSVSLLIRVL